MAPLINDHDREQVGRLHAQGLSRNAIAREIGRAPDTVRKVAESLGLSFDRSGTKNASEALRADLKVLRAQTSARLLRKANELIDQMDRPHLAFNFGGKDNTYNEHQLDRPPVADLRNLLVSAAIAIDKHMALDKHDVEVEGLTAVDAWLIHALGQGAGADTTDAG